MTKNFKGFLHLPVVGKRPLLTVRQVLAWADAHHAATGRWPNTQSGSVRESPFGENWRALDGALTLGRRGLPGGQSLARLLEEHRGVKRPLSDAGALRAAETARWLRAERRGCRATLSVELILAWADAHHAATGRWPNVKSGPIAGVLGETWSTLNTALGSGHRALPGPTTLTRFLVEHRGRQALNGPPDLTVEQVLRWADAYHDAHGRWPRPRNRGSIPGASGETWATIHHLLTKGHRGLPGPTTLTRFLLLHRGPGARNKPPDLTVEQILRWADAYHETHGCWPRTQSGRVAGTESETWLNISMSLGYGYRGMPGGSSLCRLLAEHRGVHNPAAAHDLSIEQILAWADAHHAATGTWPTAAPEVVQGAPGERWSAINEALKVGRRGLPGGSSLRRLLDEHRPEQSGKLTLELIRAWGEAHRATTGRWPRASSGAVTGAPGEHWGHINAALYRGNRGLPGGMTLSQAFGRPARLRPTEGWTRLRVPEILAWADAHHAATGRWPSARSGQIRDAPRPETWRAVDVGLVHGCRGLPGGQSLSRLLQEHRGYKPKMNAESARAREEKSRQVLAERSRHGGRETRSVEQILEAADAHRKATGRWPNVCSGPIPDLPGETWGTINRALHLGLCGLPGGTSLADLLTQNRGRRSNGLTELTVRDILRWADAYHQAHGCWPDVSAGRVDDAPADTWYNINKVLGRGGRGMPGGSSLRRLLAEHRSVRSQRMQPDLPACL